MREIKTTEFLDSLKVDKTRYCKWIEHIVRTEIKIAFSMLARYKSFGLKESEIFEIISDHSSFFFEELEERIEDEYPEFSIIEVQFTFLLIKECIKSEHNINMLFQALSKSIDMEDGKLGYTNHNNLSICPAQFN